MIYKKSTTINNFKTWNVYQLIKKLRIMNYDLRIKRKNIPCLNEINQRHIMICKKTNNN